MSASSILRILKSRADSKKAAFLPTFFKAGKGQYGEGDIFLGISVPDLRSIAKDVSDTSLEDIEALLENPYHEARLLALIMLVQQYEKADEKNQKHIANFYLDHVDHINNWDLVDVSAHKILGHFLLKRSRSILTKLAKSNHLWSERIAIVSTFAFIRTGETDETFRISEILLHHPHDLIHKAVGWMLREAGKRDIQALRSFLSRHAGTMPRTMLRYSIEKMGQSERKKYLTFSA